MTMNFTQTPSITTIMPTPIPEKDTLDGHTQQNLNPLKQNPNHPPSPPSYRRENNNNWNTMQEPRNSTTDINISLPAS